MIHDGGLKPSVESYFIEHSAKSGFQDGEDNDVDDSHVLHSPVIHHDTLQYSLVVSDDCNIYALSLGVVLLAANSTGEQGKEEEAAGCPRILHSRPKLIWPAARHTSVNVFSNKAQFLWPPQ
jgi:hypothetical protein